MRHIPIDRDEALEQQAGATESIEVMPSCGPRPHLGTLVILLDVSSEGAA